MDPQKNPLNATQDDADQQPASIQMPQDSTPSSEVTVDFNQAAPGAPSGTAQQGADAGGLPPVGSTGSVAGQNAGAAFDDPLTSSQPGVPGAPANSPATGAAPDMGLGGGGAAQPQAPVQPPADPYAVPQTTQPPAGFPDAGNIPAGQPFDPADQSGAGVPATAPVPASKADKRTVMILAVVAVVLIIAIAVLFFM